MSLEEKAKKRCRYSSCEYWCDEDCEECPIPFEFTKNYGGVEQPS